MGAQHSSQRWSVALLLVADRRHDLEGVAGGANHGPSGIVRSKVARQPPIFTARLNRHTSVN